LRGDTKEPSWTQDRQIRTEHWTLRHNTVERRSTKQEQRRKFQFGNLTATDRGPRPAACNYGTSHGHDKNSRSQMHFTWPASSEALLRDNNWAFVNSLARAASTSSLPNQYIFRPLEATLHCYQHYRQNCLVHLHNDYNTSYIGDRSTVVHILV
jgi:hypothetical protein